MSDGAQAAVYAALYDRLSATPALTGLLAEAGDSITAHALPDMALPCVVLGATREKSVPAAGDACGAVDVVIDVYSAQRGGREARIIMAAVKEAVATDLVVDGYRVVVQDVGVLEAAEMIDGKTYRARASVQVICEAEGA